MSLIADERDSLATSVEELDARKGWKDQFGLQAHKKTHSVCCKSICGIFQTLWYKT